MVVLTGSAYPVLAERIAAELRLSLGKAHAGTFADGERDVWVEERVVGQDVLLIQSMVAPTDSAIMELCLLSDAVRREGARSITAVVPYFGYARKERQSRLGEPISARVVVDMLVASGVSHIIGCDVHATAIAGFATVPFHVTSALPVFAQRIRPSITPQSIVLAPDAGGVKRARDFAAMLNLPVGFFEKQRNPHGRDVVETMSLNGVDDHRHAIIIDDLISTGSTIRQAAAYLKERGVERVDACATHMLGNDAAWYGIQESAIDQLYVGDTVPVMRPEAVTKGEVVGLAPQIAGYILTTI